MEKSHIAVMGLAVMGKNLAMNIESRGYRVSVYNRSAQKTEQFMDEVGSRNFQAAYSIEELVQSLEIPRKLILMVKAGDPTDQTIKQLIPHLSAGDIIIDGGNTLYEDTIRRSESLTDAGLRFIGTGISGGEEGALKGPSIMPGGAEGAYDAVKHILLDISAKVDGDSCCTYIGPDGAGHYVKMVHNGIEYGDMQLIGEAYHMLTGLFDLSASQLAHIFAEWNKGELDSYLIEITANIFTKKDEETSQPLVDVILDSAQQKGTGKWTSKSALDLGIPLSVITQSVFSRFLSAMKTERVHASHILEGPIAPTVESENKEDIIEAIRQTLYASKLISYAQGFAQMKAASDEYEWGLDYGSIAMIFRGGCIIRAQFLQNIKEAYDRDPNINNLLLDAYFKDIMDRYQASWRKVITLAVQHGIPVPGFSSALAYYDSYRCERLPANLLQAQRDYFGAHTYERIDKSGIFHTEWLD